MAKASSVIFTFFIILSLKKTRLKRKICPGNRPRRPVGLSDADDPHVLGNLLTDGGQVVSLMFRPRFSAEKFQVLISVRGWKD
jgi:hypothetical protein